MAPWASPWLRLWLLERGGNIGRVKHTGDYHSHSACGDTDHYLVLSSIRGIHVPKRFKAPQYNCNEE